jgi:hypothetical protein
MQQNEILSYDQYTEIERNGITLPYIVETAHGGQRLLFYGSDHTNNPNSPQFSDLEQRWKIFISEAHNPVALVEGHLDEVSEEETADRITSIVNGGESQFMVYLARRDGVPVHSPEPDRNWEATKLADEFGKDKVILYYFVRQLGLWNRYDEQGDIEAKAVDMLMHMARTYKWENVDFSIEGMQLLHQAVFDKPIDIHDRQWLYDITTPTPRGHITNVIARRSGELRDEYLLDQIENYWREGQSLYVVFGSAHAVRLEPALSKLGNG